MKRIRWFYAGIVTVLVAARAISAPGDPMTYTLTTDTGYYFASSHEGKINVSVDFTDRKNVVNIPFRLGPWNGYELEHMDENLVFFRAYLNEENEDVKIYMTAVHGIVESRFHTPEVCYINDNWKVEKRGFFPVPSGDKHFETRYFTAYKNDWEHFLVYWFMWKDSRRLMQEGCAMFRIAVRMTYIDEPQARSYAHDFIQRLSTFSLKKTPGTPAAVPAAISLKTTMPNQSSPYYPVRKNAVQWLTRQIVPNETVISPANDRRNLILSYELPKTADAYQYIFSKSSLYDNGVAVIAFCIERQFEQASRLIDAIMRMGGADGDLFFTFNTHNAWPNKDDNWGAIIRSGASAWAGQAIVFYLRARMYYDPGILTKNSELQSYLRYARIIADKMLTRMIADQKDARYGLITGGVGTYVLDYNPEIQRVEEKYVPGEVNWCSMEHNIDMYYFLRDLGRITDEKKYQDAALLMSTRLVKQCWNDREGQFNRGQTAAKPDEVMALDCASWGAMLLFSIGDNERARQALKSTDAYLSTGGIGMGYKPYIKKRIFERYNAGKYYYPENPKKSWDDIDFMWTEGALGVALAQIRGGNTVQAEEIVKHVLTYQSATGGIQYASLYIPHEFSGQPAVAPSGWLSIVIGNLEKNPIALLFWD